MSTPPDDPHKAQREHILRAFGITEADLAALDNGWLAARADANAQQAKFIAELEARRDEITAELQRTLDDPADRSLT